MPDTSNGDTQSSAHTSTKVPKRHPLELTSAQRRSLRSSAHGLKAIVQVGKDGLSQGVIEATKVALEQHELVKVSINGESPTERKSGADQLAYAAGAHVIQVIGRVLVLYRQRLHKPTIVLPKPKKRRSTSGGGAL